MTIAIVDYGIGNTFSVAAALQRLGADITITSDASIVQQADRVVIPGVGDARAAMNELRLRGLDTVIPLLEQPVLGICLGMQLLCRNSEEGDTQCMGVFDADVVRFDGPLKVPHMGWNTIERTVGPLFRGVDQGTFMYFVHSYHVTRTEMTVALSDYSGYFSAGLSRRNFFGVQFHPEKSGAAGARLLENFMSL
ncbi:MAG: imidazole glycerol phosphate synthase subunit HisH [Bacteroidetes bacterium]|nr:imidazole glycerol phosphate synthase subunit HisH [Bacteroidota bacterium]